MSQGDSRPWYQKPTRVLQFNIEDRYGSSIEDLTGTELARLAHDLGANVLVIFARDGWGRVFYRGGEVGPEHSKMVGDIVRDAVKEGRKLGVKVVAMVAHTANRWLYRKHAEWAQINARGETILLEHVPYHEEGYEPEWPQMCLNSPFKDFIRKEVLEALELGVDGIFLDSFRYQPDYERSCYCEWCRRRFKEEHGYEMPEKPDWRDSRWRELWDWRYRVVVERLKELHALVKSRKPDALFMYNSHPGGWAGRTNRVVEEGRDYLDAVFAECSEADHQPPGFITEMVKLTKAMLGGGKTVWASRNYFHLYRTVVPSTPLNIRQGLRETIIAGGSPWALIFSNSYAQDRTALNAIKEVFEEHKRIEEYLDGAEPIPYAAIVVSNITRDHYGRDRPEHYVDEVRGFYYALKHEHVPVDFIAGRDLTSEHLRKYSVVILANTVCLPDNALEALNEYVRGGGGLIATYLTSTCGDGCVERYEFGLADVLNARLRGILKLPWTYVTPLNQKHPLLKGVHQAPILVGDMSYDFTRERVALHMGWHAMVRSDAEVVARVALPASEWGFEYTLGRSPPAIAGSTELPAITTSAHGEGRSTYYTWQLGRHYWRVGLPTYRRLIVNAVKYVARDDAPVRVEAPETINTEYFRQGDRVIIHLLNHTYNQRIQAIGVGKTKQPIPGYSTSAAVHPPREVIPVTNITVKVRVSDPSRFVARAPLRNGATLESRSEGEWLVVNVDGLREYEVVIVEPKG